MVLAPLLFILFIWIFMGVLISVVVRSAKKSAAKRKAGPRIPSRDPAPRQLSMDLPESQPGPAVPQAADARIRPIRSALLPMQHDDSLFQGSLNAVTGEGYDPCHDEQMEPLTLAESAPEPPSPAVPGLRLSWAPEEVVRGFVMSEILTRKTL